MVGFGYMIGTATNRDLILSIKNTRCCLLDGYFGSRLFRTFLSCGGDGMLAAVPKPKRLRDPELIKKRARIGLRYVGGGKSVRFITASSSGVDGVVLPLRHR